MDRPGISLGLFFIYKNKEGLSYHLPCVRFSLATSNAETRVKRNKKGFLDSNYLFTGFGVEVCQLDGVEKVLKSVLATKFSVF